MGSREGVRKAREKKGRKREKEGRRWRKIPGNCLGGWRWGPAQAVLIYCFTEERKQI